MSQQEYSALKNLEPLLRKTIGEEVSVVSYKASSLLPLGENYGSLMLKLDVLIKKSKDSPEEELNLVAKLIPSNLYALTHIKTAITFEKEIFLFEKLAPAYREIEQDTGLKNEYLKDLFPEYYGGQLVEDEKNPGMALENAVLLLKNIKIDGYDTMDRRKGLDLAHTKLALSELARFHALGVAAMKFKPDLMVDAKKLMTEFPFEFVESEIEKFVGQTFKVIAQDPRTAKYLERIEKSVRGLDWRALLMAEPVEPWITVTHGDFWVNNMMFKDGKNGIEDMKFIDFQVMRICSPLCDLPYFLFASTNPEVLRNHFDEILDLYYNRFIEVLRKTGCDATPFGRKCFDEELDRVAKLDLFRCITAVKFITLDASEIAKADMNDFSAIMGMTGSQLYFDRVCDIISKYLEKGWF